MTEEDQTAVLSDAGIPIERVYGDEQPGAYPFTRGIHPEMYRSRPWRMRQYAGFGTVTETKARWATLLSSGQNGISAAFDLPTQLGMASDHPSARAEVGRLGVAVDSLEDMVELLEDVPLDKVAATFNINAPAVIIYAYLVATARRQGVDLASVTGTLSNDPLVEIIARGLWRVPPKAALKLFADTFESGMELTPGFYPVNIRGCLFYEAGASDVQEIAFSLSCGKEYLRSLVERGLSPDAVGTRFSYMMFADHNLLEQAAKFRAARRMWARICQEEFGITSDSAKKYRVTAPVGSYNFKAQQPQLNIIRGAYGALAAALGGAQAMLVAGYDEAYAIPTEHAALLGLRTQQVLAEEAGVTKTVDPLGGSHYVEAMTDEMESRAQALIDQIDEVGGMAEAIERGIPQQAIADNAFRVEQSIESGEKRVVGVNCYVTDDDPQEDLELHVADDAARDAQLARLARFHAGRDRAAVTGALERVAKAAAGGENVVPELIEAAEAGATLGELMDVFVAEYGEYVEPVRH